MPVASLNRRDQGSMPGSVETHRQTSVKSGTCQAHCTPEWCGVSWNGRSGFAIARVFDSSVVRRVRRPVEPVYVQRPVVVAPPPVYYGSPYYYGPPVVVYGPRYYRSWGYGYRRW